MTSSSDGRPKSHPYLYALRTGRHIASVWRDSGSQIVAMVQAADPPHRPNATVCSAAGSLSRAWRVFLQSEMGSVVVVNVRFLLFDHDSKFGSDVVAAVSEMGSEPMRTAYRSPWQNGVAERWVRSCRRDLLDHVIVLNEQHLKRLMSEYVRYYQEDRTHLGLAKNTPAGRLVEVRSPFGNKIQSLPRVGGLHHRYEIVA